MKHKFQLVHTLTWCQYKGYVLHEKKYPQHTYTRNAFRILVFNHKKRDNWTYCLVSIFLKKRNIFNNIVNKSCVSLLLYAYNIYTLLLYSRFWRNEETGNTYIWPQSCQNKITQRKAAPKKIVSPTSCVYTTYRRCTPLADDLML